MISIQDLYAIKDVLQDNVDSYTRGYECQNLIDIIDQQIDANEKLEQLAEILMELHNPKIDKLLQQIIPAFESRLDFGEEE